jgi:hypothetical protein
VLLISVDGLHAIDLSNWLATHPNSTFAKLAAHGIVYPNAFTTAPSDSFPGMLAQVTGGSPLSRGLFYDDSYDCKEYPSKNYWIRQGKPDAGYTGNAGTEVTNFEERNVFRHRDIGSAEPLMYLPELCSRKRQ